jgi:hypothetical protein
VNPVLVVLDQGATAVVLVLGLAMQPLHANQWAEALCGHRYRCRFRYSLLPVPQITRQIHSKHNKSTTKMPEI